MQRLGTTTNGTNADPEDTQGGPYRSFSSATKLIQWIARSSGLL